MRGEGLGGRDWIYPPFMKGIVVKLGSSINMKKNLNH
jgi:hypothetical protein